MRRSNSNLTLFNKFLFSIIVNFHPSFSNFLSFFEAFSRFSLYLFGDGRSKVEPVAKKDAVTIGASSGGPFKICHCELKVK